MIFQIVHLTTYDAYCLMIKDENTGEYFGVEEYSDLLEAMGVVFREMKVEEEKT